MASIYTGNFVGSNYFFVLKQLHDRSGTVWDVNLYDQKYIYLWLTEGDNVNSPYLSTNFKKSAFDSNFIMSPRCISASGYPAWEGFPIDTSYDTYEHCSFMARNTLGKVKFAIWGPYNETLGGGLPDNLPVMRLAYYNGCDQNFQHCTKEESHFAQRYGLVQWKLYVDDQGQTTPDWTATYNTLSARQIPLQFSCMNTIDYLTPLPYSSTLPNLALNQATTQSSTAFSGTSDRAVDGNTSGSFADNTVTHTNSDPNAWWQVDLGAVKSIQQINVWNRTDCCSERLTDFWVFVSDTPFTSTNLNTTIQQSSVWNYHATWQGRSPTVFTPNRTGRYVRIQLAGTNNLSLAEVQVFGN